MRMFLWLCVLVGAALSLQLSYGIATQSVVVGSRAGHWVFGYLQPVSWRALAVFAIALVATLALLRASSSMVQRQEWRWLLVWFVAAVAIEGVICSLAPFRFEPIFVSDGANSFYSVAQRYTPATILGDFERVRAYWPPHAQSNMPGKAILVYWLRQISKDPAVIPWLVLAVSNIGGLFLYGLARDLFDRQTALYAFILYVVTPGKMFFFPLMNTVAPVFVLMAAWLLVRWLRSHNVLYAAPLGMAIYAIVLFEPLGLAIGGLFVGLIVWALSRSVIGRSTLLWQGAVALVTFAASAASIQRHYGFDMLSTVRLLAADTVKFNVDALRPYDVWVWQNLVDFLMALGVCQAVLVLAAIVDGLMSGGTLRARLTTPAVVVAVSLIVVLGVTDGLGVNRGEVVRLWVFLACAFQLPAAYVCARLNNHLAFAIVLAVTLLHDALGTAMIGFILPG